MRAVCYDRAGPATVLRAADLPRPEPGPGEVRVRVIYSALNPTDIKRRRTGRDLGRFPLIIPHQDGAGVIVAVGAGVDDHRIGDRCWLFGAQAGRAFGTAADYVCLPSDRAILLPDTVAMATGAALGVPAVTAHYGLTVGGRGEEETVWVAGANGRVGRMAVDLGRWMGARILASARRPVDGSTITGNGEALARTLSDAAGSGGINRLIDPALAAHIKIAAEILKPRGKIAAYGSDDDPTPALPFHQMMYKNLTLYTFSIFGIGGTAQRQAFADITEAAAAGALNPKIAPELRFDDIMEAHRRMESDDPADRFDGMVLFKLGEE